MKVKWNKNKIQKMTVNENTIKLWSGKMKNKNTKDNMTVNIESQ